MTNGYKILWTDFALKELKNTIEYLEENWTERELRNLASEIEEKLRNTIEIISFFSNRQSPKKRKLK
jgi:plasmid stabilization system protein ParE